MEHTSRSLEDSAAKGDLNYGGLAWQISEEKNICMWPIDNSCEVLAMNVATKLVSFGLIALAEEISKQPGIDFDLWLLVSTLI